MISTLFFAELSSKIFVDDALPWALQVGLLWIYGSQLAERERRTVNALGSEDYKIQHLHCGVKLIWQNTRMALASLALWSFVALSVIGAIKPTGSIGFYVPSSLVSLVQSSFDLYTFFTEECLEISTEELISKVLLAETAVFVVFCFVLFYLAAGCRPFITITDEVF
jgi:hypothetical protein